MESGLQLLQSPVLESGDGLFATATMQLHYQLTKAGKHGHCCKKIEQVTRWRCSSLMKGSLAPDTVHEKSHYLAASPLRSVFSKSASGQTLCNSLGRVNDGELGIAVFGVEFQAAGTEHAYRRGW